MPTVTLMYREFPSRIVLPGKVMFDAVAYSNLEASAPSIDRHAFKFWCFGDLSSSIMDTHFSISLGTMPFSATAWYVGTGGGNDPCTSVAVYGFSERLNDVLSESPVESVSPNSAWRGGNTNVVNVKSSDVEITAKPFIGNDVFDKWMAWGATVSGRTVIIKQGNCPLIIAVYKGRPIFKPRPAIDELRDALAHMMNRFPFPGPIGDPSPMDRVRLRDLLEGVATKQPPVAIKKKGVQKKTRRK